VLKKKNSATRKPASIRWEFDPEITTHDFFEGGSLDDMWNLQEAVDSFVPWLEEDHFLMWEAVVCEEQGNALTPRQKKALDNLLNFNDEEDDGILYIDEIPRPSEPWHVILNKIVPHLLIEPYRTFDCHEEVKWDGWNRIVTALQEHGKGLSLPPGVESAEAVVPAELRHKLSLQFCFNDLCGLGREDSMPLEDPEQNYRVDWCIESLRKCKASVAYFGLTLEALLTRVILPAKDQPIFLRMMQDRLRPEFAPGTDRRPPVGEQNQGDHALRKLEFIGNVQADTAPQLIIPGRDDLFLKPDDWPSHLAPGFVAIEVSKFPENFAEIGEGEGLASLDAGKFRPALVIPQRKIIGSTLTPDADHPTKGFAGAWRADLYVIGTGQEATCWAMWIIGSDATQTIRLVAEKDLRNRLNLANGTAVKITIWEAESNSKPPTPEEIIADWCEAARGIEGGFGREKAMGYLIGEKFLHFLEVAEMDREWQQAFPAFVDEIKDMFEPWQLAEFLNTPRRLGALGHASAEDGHRLLRAEWDEEQRLREDARNLMMLEWAKELLLEE